MSLNPTKYFSSLNLCMPRTQALAIIYTNLDFSFLVQKAWLPGSCSLNVKHVYIIPMYKSISSVWFTNIWNSHLIQFLDEVRLWCSPHASFFRHYRKLHDAISSMFKKPEQILNSYVICNQEGVNCCVQQKNVWLSIKKIAWRSVCKNCPSFDIFEPAGHRCKDLRGNILISFHS